MCEVVGWPRTWRFQKVTEFSVAIDLEFSENNKFCGLRVFRKKTGLAFAADLEFSEYTKFNYNL